ncbi:uncharacterized protein ColSpa_11721 [Colletotrichum spaethianum]|uniref:LPXTG-domain-containing protein n=1 Tax=Colletotrichum spaethianum TaxID=700344 RepID=A0AA37UPY3_9PEZI|nr:uncharacterized protein ColSpa_11721 [Colletotrichum spaethianum]GKT51540.1 hypothetical protein ColSpa_11721 [Colletotrichum spaethianum]
MFSIFLFAGSFLALTSLVTGVVDDYDQCYFDAGYVGPQSLLPCLPGNSTDSGYSWCCMAGQNCLNQACYDAKTGMTYQYGCNDPTYKDKNCPVKGGLDRAKSPWVGLVQCLNANEGQLKFWACNHPDTCGENCPTEPDRPQATQSVWPFEIQPLPPLNDCNDLGNRVLAMYAPSTLGSTGGVPSSYTPPTNKPSPTRPPLRDSEATTTAVSFTMSASEIASSSTDAISSAVPGTSSSALSNGAIAGIAISSTAVVLSAFFAMFILFRRRRARQLGTDPTPIDLPDHRETGPAELPDEKCNLMYLNTPPITSDGAHKRSISDVTFSAFAPSPLSTPRTPASASCAPGPHMTLAEIPEQARTIHEMPAINEPVEMP